MREYLIKGIEKLNLQYTNAKIDNLLKYLDLLVEYNKHTNLTAIRDEREIIEKHFLDSLLLQKFIDKSIKNAIDIGTGAGFPGMVLAIFNPEINFTLMDSVGKKTKFLELISQKLSLNNVSVVNMRAEEYASPKTKENFDLGLCRGVSKLSTILEYIIPFLKVGGIFLCQKMSNTHEEMEAKNALITLNSEILHIYTLNLPYSQDERVVIEIEKVAKNDDKYPRRVGMPLKKPL